MMRLTLLLLLGFAVSRGAGARPRTQPRYRSGVHDVQARHVLVTTSEIAWTHGTRKKFNALERPQLVFADHVIPVTLVYTGAYMSDRTHSFNVPIPLLRQEVVRGAVPRSLPPRPAP